MDRTGARCVCMTPCVLLLEQLYLYSNFHFDASYQTCEERSANYSVYTMQCGRSRSKKFRHRYPHRLNFIPGAWRAPIVDCIGAFCMVFRRTDHQVNMIGFRIASANTLHTPISNSRQQRLTHTVYRPQLNEKELAALRMSIGFGFGGGAGIENEAGPILRLNPNCGFLGSG